MKRSFFIFIFVFTASTFVSSQPKIKFDKTDHDFGEVIVNSYPKTTFKFKNVGDLPLVLTKVKTSCGCTTPRWPKDTILPGGSGEIEVVFNSRGYKNKSFAKSVIVSYNRDNGGTAKAQVLYIHGKVVPKVKPIPQYPLKISSQIIDLGLMKYGRKKEIIISLQNEGDSIVLVKGLISSCDQCMQVVCDPMRIEAGQNAQITVTYLSKSHEPRSIKENIKILTSLDKKYLHELSIKGITVVGETLKGKEYKERIKVISE